MVGATWLSPLSGLVAFVNYSRGSVLASLALAPGYPIAAPAALRTPGYPIAAPAALRTPGYLIAAPAALRGLWLRMSR